MDLTARRGEPRRRPLRWPEVGRVRVRVLGPIGLERDGEPIEVRSRRQRAILAMLAAAGGEVVGEDVLIDGVWGDDLPDAPSAALRTQITRLRGLIGAPDAVVHRDAGYALGADVVDVDAWAFGDALQAVAGEHANRRAVALAAALDMWHGRAFAELADISSVQPAAARLDELRRRAGDDLAEALLDAGDPIGAAGTLETIVAEDPLRERSRALLMRALYAAGRPTEALETFQDHRRRLADELGLTPSPTLTELESAILAHRVSPAATSGASASGTLPPLPVTELVGRTEALAQLVDLFSAARIVTIVGPGGVGKTRLAMHAAKGVRGRYPDGVWWCDLTSATDDAVAHTVASALGIDERAGETVDDRVIAVLGARRALLVLDNCEHVLDGVSTLVGPLVRTARTVDVLVTSREPLGIDGEHRFRLAPLPVPVGDEVTDAVELLLQRVRAVAPDAIAEEGAWDAVLQICRSLDGLPLALEFAAARVAHMTVADVARQLDDRFGLLVSTGRSTGRRHDGLAETLAWSYQLLSDEERTALDAMTVFAGAFTLDDAIHLIEPAGEDGSRTGSVVSTLGSLVDKSLVERGESGGTARYRLLETVRAFGAERLAASGATATWRRRHATFVVDLVERTDAALRGPREAAHQHVLDEHAGDLRTARAWLVDDRDIDGLLRLCGGLRWFTDLRTRPEPFRWAEDAVARGFPEFAEHPQMPAVLGMAAAGAIKRGHLDAAEALAARAEELSRQTSGVGVEILSRVALFRGELDAAVAYSRAAQERFRATGDEFAAVMAGTAEVLGLRYAGHRADASAAVGRLLDGARDVGCPSQLAFCEYCAAEVVIDDADRARSHLVRARELARSTGAEFVLGLALTTLAGIDVRRRGPEAADHLRAALEHWERAGSWKQQWWLTLRFLIALLADRREHRAVAVLAAAFEASTTPGPVYGQDADRLEAAVAAARADLGRVAFEEAVVAGAALDDAGALAFGKAALGAA